jgi:hypothetical protein
MKLKFLATLALGALSLPAAIIYSENFESVAAGAPPAVYSGSSIAVESTGGFSAFGFGSQHLRNSGGGAPSTVLSLSGLGAHSSLTISFDLIVWDSMDTGKLFNLTADGTALINGVNAANYFAPGGVFDGPGTLVSPQVIDFGNPNFGNNSGFRDQGRQIVNLNLAHSASTLTLNFFYSGNGVSGGGDESWGIDNIVISDNNSVQASGVPEPSTFALGGAALALLAWKRRR